MHFDDIAAALRRPVGDRRRRDQQVEVELALEPLAHDLHVQQAEESAAEAEAERLRRLRLVRERPVVELEPLERIPQLRVLVGVRREDPGEDHRLHVLVPGQRLDGRSATRRERVPHPQSGHVLEAGHDVAHLARAERRDRLPHRRHDSELLRLERGSLDHRAQRLARLEAAVDDADEGDHAAVLVVRGVEDERAGGRLGIPGRRRNPLDDRVEDLVHTRPRLRGDAEHPLGRLADQLRELGRRRVGIRLREVDLVRDRDDLEVVVEREVGVGQRLRLDALRRVDEEQRPLAGLERARDLVAEVDVAGSVDQVQEVVAPAHSHGLGLDRDPALALEVHGVEKLLAHLALGDCAGQLEDAIGERRLAVVDVRDDREVADPIQLHRRSALLGGIDAPGSQQ